MTENEAIEMLENHTQYYAPNEDLEALNAAIKALDEIQEYRKIGMVEECREAVEKTKAKKIIKRSFIIPYEGIDACPVCKEQLGRITKFCMNCGQRLEE